MGLKKTVFGRTKIKPNTFIGGVSATINTPALIANKLGISVSRIKAFNVTGSDIQFAVIGGSYTIPAIAFRSTTITYYNDSQGLVTSINSGAFGSCTNFTYCIFPECTKITSGPTQPNGTFDNCLNLTTVTIPKFTADATSKDFMFSGCSKLTSLSFPLYNGKIGESMFDSCSLLTSVTIGITGAVGIRSFIATKITSIDLTNATSIGDVAFTGSLLTGDIVGNNITTIGIGAFSNTKITSFSSTSCTTLSSNTFGYCQNLTSVSLTNCNTINNGTTEPQGIFNNSGNLVSINLPVLTTLNGSYSFAGCTNINTIYMPVLITLGATTGNNNNFNFIKSGCTITVKSSLATANAGSPDGDLVYASSTRGAIIVYA